MTFNFQAFTKRSSTWATWPWRRRRSSPWGMRTGSGINPIMTVEVETFGWWLILFPSLDTTIPNNNIISSEIKRIYFRRSLTLLFIVLQNKTLPVYLLDEALPIFQTTIIDMKQQNFMVYKTLKLTTDWQFSFQLYGHC